MDFLKTLLAYMTLLAALGVQEGPALDAVPTPTQLPPHVTATLVPYQTAAPTATPTPEAAAMPTITPNYRYDIVQFGDSGSAVRKLQNRLIDLGYMPAGSADSQFGYQTYNAVKAFQRANALAADGVAGPATLTNLYENEHVIGVAEATPVPTATAAPTVEPPHTPPPMATEVRIATPTPDPTAAPTATPAWTEVPVTEAPATEVPATEPPAPATEIPVTEAPATEVPVTEVPVTEVPVTEVPVTEVPVTEVPATEVPATETPAPATEVPVTEAPTASPTPFVIPIPSKAPATATPEPEVPEVESAAEGALQSIGWKRLRGGYIISGNTGEPMYLKQIINGQITLVRPQLWLTPSGSAAVSLNELYYCIKDWQLRGSLSQGQFVLNACGYEVIIHLSGEASVTVDGVPVDVNLGEIFLVDGDPYVTDNFLIQTLKAEVILDLDENSLLLYFTDKSLAESQD